jgi:hypothetical protein
VEASNLCNRTLIFGSSFYCLFVKVFFSFFLFIHPFSFSLLSVWLSFLLFSVWFFITLLFHPCFILIFLAHVVLSLVYPNFLESKWLGCCYCCYFLKKIQLNLYFTSARTSGYFQQRKFYEGRALRVTQGGAKLNGTKWQETWKLKPVWSAWFS